MITFSIGIFLWLSIIYLYFKRVMKWGMFQDSMFVVAVMAALGTINVTTMMDCNNPEMALLYTFIPWMFIFVPMLVALHFFPNWKAPFSNTLGYFVISFYKKNINTLINLLIHLTILTCLYSILMSYLIA